MWAISNLGGELFGLLISLLRGKQHILRGLLLGWWLFRLDDALMIRSLQSSLIECSINENLTERETLIPYILNLILW